jgi:hypothetical protein
MNLLAAFDNDLNSVMAIPHSPIGAEPSASPLSRGCGKMPARYVMLRLLTGL